MNMTILKNKKFVKYGVITIVIIVAIVLLVNYAKKTAEKRKERKQNNEILQRQKDEANAITAQRTLTDSQINSFVAKLYKAMKGIGTDEVAVYNVFSQIENLANLYALIAAFGIKDGETLSEWIYDDLNSNEISRVNEILASQNINYKF